MVLSTPTLQSFPKLDVQHHEVLKSSTLRFDNLQGVQSSLLNSFNNFPKSIQYIVVINFVFFLFYQFFPRFMHKYAASSGINRQGGRFWTLLTSAFSHHQFFHLFANITTFCSIAPVVLEIFRYNENSFCEFIFLSALLSGLTSVLYCYLYCLLQPNQQKIIEKVYTSEIGFSGVNCALLYVFARAYPERRMTMMGFQMDARTVSHLE